MAGKANIVSPTDEREAQALNERGLQQYQRWEIQEAIESFEKATELVPTNPDYHLNLARALARFGSYDRMCVSWIGLRCYSPTRWMRWKLSSPKR
jgi:Flp pilus assembly protein TadD